MLQKYKNKIKCMTFLGIFIGILLIINKIFLLKSYELNTNLNTNLTENFVISKQRGFYQEKKNSIDILFLGSSQVHCSINPVILWDEYGVTSYDFSADQQDYITSYYYLKEAFKTQSPKIVVLEVGNYVEETDAVAMHFSFDALKPSANKYDGIIQRVQRESIKELIFPIVRYHSRWDELLKSDFQSFTEDKEHKFNGYFAYCVQNAQLPQSDDGILEDISLNQEQLKYLDAYRKLCEEHNAKLIFLKTPTAIGNKYKGKLKALAEYAHQHNIDFLNYNFKGTEILDYNTDMADTVHMNIFGSEKFTKRLGKDILACQQISTNYSSAIVERYNDKSKMYWYMYNDFMLTQIADIDTYLEEIRKNPNYIAFVTGRCDLSMPLNYKKFSSNENNEWSYIGIIEDGEDCVDKHLYDGQTYKYAVDGNVIELESNPQTTCSTIKLNGEDISVGARGINIVVYDKVCKKVIDSKGFDIYTM